MLYLLDTNVLTEPTKPVPAEAVLRWFAATPAEQIALSVLSIGEIRKGVAQMPNGARRRKTEAWLESELPARFSERLLPVNAAVADAWGRLAAAAKAGGRTLHAIDGLLLATAQVYSLTLVSRDQDCPGRGVPVLNPWP